MKALLIDPQARTIEAVDVNSRADIVALVGYDSIIADRVGPADDYLFFDEDCFLRGTEGRFQIDTIIPVSGKGVVVGSPDEGDTLCDVIATAESLGARLKYL